MSTDLAHKVCLHLLLLLEGFVAHQVATNAAAELLCCRLLQAAAVEHILLARDG